MPSVIVFKDADQADVETPSTDKKAVFFDNSVSPAQPAYMDDAGNVQYFAVGELNQIHPFLLMGA